MHLQYKKRMIVFYTTIIFLIVFDRLFKRLAINGFFDQPLYIINDILKLSFSGNYNIAFSMPLSGLWLKIVIGLIILRLVYYLLYLLKREKYGDAGYLAYVIIGAASNLLDRFKYGFVIDYFDLKYFTIFNLADALIVAGVTGLVWLMLLNCGCNKKFTAL